MNGLDVENVRPVPEAPGALPVIGHAVPLLRSPFEFLRSLPAHGGLVQIRLGTSRVFMVCDPDLTHEMLVQDRLFDKGGALVERARQTVSGNGLFTCPSHEHRRQRRLVQPAFHRANLPGYAQVMSDHIAKVLDSWSDGQILDVSREMQKISSTVLLSAMLGGSLGDDAIAQIEDDISTLVKGIYVRMLLPDAITRLPIFPGSRRYSQAGGRTRRILTEVITRRRATAAGEGDDLLSRLLAVRDVEGDGQGMSEIELIDQVTTFYVAGTETTSTTLSWALSLAARHPKVANALYEEARTAVAGTTATWEDLPRLTYTRNTFTEALRLYPPAWLLTRMTTTNARLGDYAVPAGTTIAYSPYIIGRLPDIHVDAERFDPDRWSADSPYTPPRNALVSFGGGARKCIGDEFGMAEGVLALASIMKRWRMEAQPGTGHRPQLGVALRPKALRLKVKAHASHAHAR